MNSRARELTQTGIEALNASLVRLGCPPVGENPEVRFGDLVVGGFPTIVVDKPGVAPMVFLIGFELVLGIGQHSEVIDVDLAEEPRDRVEDLITRVLRSQVLCRARRWSDELVLQIPGEEPWLTLRTSPRRRDSPLEPRYEPFAPSP